MNALSKITTDALAYAIIDAQELAYKENEEADVRLYDGKPLAVLHEHADGAHVLVSKVDIYDDAIERAESLLAD